MLNGNAHELPSSRVAQTAIPVSCLSWTCRHKKLINTHVHSRNMLRCVSVYARKSTLIRKYNKIRCKLQGTRLTPALPLLKELTRFSFASGAYVYVRTQEAVLSVEQAVPHTISIRWETSCLPTYAQQGLALTFCSTWCQALGAGRACQEHAALQRHLVLWGSHLGTAPQQYCPMPAIHTEPHRCSTGAGNNNGKEVGLHCITFGKNSNTKHWQAHLIGCSTRDVSCP